jgi:hypothetical protein
MFSHHDGMQHQKNISFFNAVDLRIVPISYIAHPKYV